MLHAGDAPADEADADRGDPAEEAATGECERCERDRGRR
jgi:hypothetical protein